MTRVAVQYTVLVKEPDLSYVVSAPVYCTPPTVMQKDVYVHSKQLLTIWFLLV